MQFQKLLFHQFLKSFFEVQIQNFSKKSQKISEKTYILSLMSLKLIFEGQKDTQGQKDKYKDKDNPLKCLNKVVNNISSLSKTLSHDVEDIQDSIGDLRNTTELRFTDLENDLQKMKCELKLYKMVLTIEIFL